jgi:pimeloyl-ACP methyl ester carboxylesterase
VASFVLVHGSWHGAWCWRLVAPLLGQAGHEVHAPTLTGLGDRSHLQSEHIDLATHITDVVNVFFYEDIWDAVLVGHSYAGLVVTAVAEAAPERVAMLVYLDAYVPTGPQSWFDLQTPEHAAAECAHMATTGLRVPASADVLGITSPELAAWVEERLTPQPRATYEQRVPAGGQASQSIPRVYIHCTAGPMADRLLPFAQQARGLGWRTYELASGHDAMLTAPNDLSALLVSLVPERLPGVTTDGSHQ